MKRKLLYILVLVISFCLILALKFADSAYAAHEYYKTITIESDQVDATLTNFPVLVNTTNNDLKDVSNSGHVYQSDGGDIRFTSSDGSTQYDHEIESYTPSTGKLIAWVEVPSVSSSVDTIFRMYYGNSEAGDQWDVAGTWDGSDHEAVYHLHDDFNDSANSHTGTNYSTTDATGHIADGQNFNGVTGTRIDMGDSTDFEPSSFTLEAFVKREGDCLYDVCSVFSKGSSNFEGYALAVLGSSHKVELKINDNNGNVPANQALGTTTILIDTWYHIVGTYNSNTQELKVYVNGELEDTNTNTNAINYSTASLKIGSANNNNDIVFNGVIDEVRLTPSVRSDDWIDAEYNNQKSSSTFLTIGTETATYTVTFDGNTNDGGSVPTAITQDYDTEVTVLGNTGSLTKTGYTFDGWNTEAGGGGTAYVADDTFNMPASNTTLYAQWTTVTYDITYNLDSGSNHGSNPATYTIETATITLEDPTKTGYTFGGWYSEAEFNTEITEITIGSNGNVILYTQWAINEYTVTFDGNTNDGGAVPSDIVQNYDTEVTVLGNTGSLTKTEYTFDGWNTETGGGGTAYVADDTFNMPVDGITLYAQWATVTYDITYNLDGGSNHGSNPATYTIESSTITLEDATKTGYTFGGWYSEAEFTNEITGITIGSTGNVTLYAEWELIPVVDTPAVPAATIPPTEEETEEEEEEEEIPEEIVVEEITEEEIAEVIKILKELEEEGEEINQEEDVTITVGELEIGTKGIEVIHVYQDNDLKISIPLDTLVGEDS